MASLTWHVSYQKSRGFYLHLNNTPAYVEAVSPILEKVADFFMGRLPYYPCYRVGNAIMCWLYNQEKSVLVLSITKEQAFLLQPGEWEWFYEGDDADV
jgi:hypothetical protein